MLVHLILRRIDRRRSRGGNETFRSPFAGVRAAIHVQYFARSERGVRQK
jgi:hypothetical protein